MSAITQGKSERVVGNLFWITFAHITLKQKVTTQYIKNSPDYNNYEDIKGTL